MATIEEIHYEFLLQADSIGGNERRGFSVSQVDWLLNKATKMLINNYVTLFESDLRKINELSTLHVKWPLQPTIVATEHTTQNINGRTIYVYEVPLEKLVYEHHSITRISGYVTKSNCDYKAYGKYKDNDDLDDALVNSFDLDEKSFLVNIGKSSTTPITPTREQVSLYIYSLYPIKDKNVFIEYIKKPKKSNIGGYIYFDGSTTTKVECELPEILQSKMIDLAVTLAYGSLKDDAYNMKKDILNIN